PTAIAWEAIEPVESGETGVKLKVSHEDLAKLHPSDIAEIISQLDQHHVQEVLETLDDEAAADTIGEVSPDLQVQLLEGLEPARAHWPRHAPRADPRSARRHRPGSGAAHRQVQLAGAADRRRRGPPAWHRHRGRRDGRDPA